ncbi:MAG: hypothetical protein HGA49_12270 [Eubacteriaceae bacterium]|nr:hypothetical protein [Eubacteriaceae bacterium]
MTVSAESALDILTPYIETFQNGILAGFHEYTEQYGHLRHKHSAHARAIIIHDHILHYLKSAFSGVDGVRCFKHNGLDLIGIDSNLFIRVKKMNNNMHTSNIPTRQSVNFSGQLSFEGFSNIITNINLGYIPNDVWTQPKRILITCPNGNTLITWYLDITKHTPNTILLDLPNAAQETIVKKRIKAKIPKNQTGS